MSYSIAFELKFSELSEGLQKKKVDGVIENNFLNGEYGEGKELEFYLDKLLLDESVRKEAVEFIEAHFPIRF